MTTTTTQGSYLMARATIPMRFKTSKGGVSKNPEYVQTEGVPLKIVDVAEMPDDGPTLITLNSLHSEPDREFTVENTPEILQKHFETDESGVPQNPLMDDECSLFVPKMFPNEKSRANQTLNIDEFNKREHIKTIKSLVANHFKISEPFEKTPENQTKKIVSDKLEQLFASKGDTRTPSISKLDAIANRKNSEPTTHKREAGMNFNRTKRWCPPVDMTYEEFENTASYPYPLGIRPNDFCLPSELLDTVGEMLTQICSMKNVDKTLFETLNEKFKEEGHDDWKLDIARPEHLCKYCGKSIDAMKYKSEYMSKTKFMEICHRDPNERFIKENMYWGHGECNRRQGGYSEDQRMDDRDLLQATWTTEEKTLWSMERERKKGGRELQKEIVECRMEKMALSPEEKFKMLMKDLSKDEVRAMLEALE